MVKKIYLTTKQLTREHKQNRLEKGDRIDIISDEQGQLMISESALDHKQMVKYLKADRFLRIPLNYIM